MASATLSPVALTLTDTPPHEVLQWWWHVRQADPTLSALLLMTPPARSQRCTHCSSPGPICSTSPRIPR